MDFPACELLTELKNEGNLIAQFILAYPDTFFEKNDGGSNAGATQNHVFDPKSLIDKLSMLVVDRDFGPSADQKEWAFLTKSDLRIKNLVISGYRGIPNGNKDGEKYYGLSFTDRTKRYLKGIFDNNDPASYIILGCNGSGKTTLYSALELLLLNKTSIEDKHRIESAEEKNKFRHYLGNTNNPIFISATLVDSAIVPQYTSNIPPLSDANRSIIDNIDLSPFFCSESNLSMVECSGIEMNNYLDDTIGLRGINTIIKRSEVLIQETEARIDELSHDSEDGQKLSEEEKQAKKSQFGQVLDFLTKIRSRAFDKIAQIKQNLLPQAQFIISSLMVDYEDDKVELSYSQQDGIIMFNGNLKLKGGSETINPRYYFNNFRFKLYLVSLKVAMAFYIMQTRKISFPLVFDDIFDSSDFTNRKSSKDYFNKIFQVYDELKILEDKPLQIIFFTQDEVIAESIYDGICDLWKKSGNASFTDECYPPRKAKLVRLFTPDEASTTDLFPFNKDGYNNYTEYVFNLCDIIKQTR